MKRVVVVCVSHRGQLPDAQRFMREAVAAGAVEHTCAGASEVALARNIMLTTLLDAFPPSSKQTIALLVDDDMMLNLQAAQRLVELAEQHWRPISGCYVDNAGALLQRRVGDVWECGLGFMAIPLDCLRVLALDCERVETAMLPKGVIAFCWCGPHKGHWRSEDTHLSQRLRPMVARLRAGHVKPFALWPDNESVQRLVTGEDVVA